MPDSRLPQLNVESRVAALGGLELNLISLVVLANVNDHRLLERLGYAVTSHSSQGLTAERVLVNADTGVHPRYTILNIEEEGAGEDRRVSVTV